MPDTGTAALQRLHDQHAEALWRYVVHLTGDRSRADDVVQETLLRAWRSAVSDTDDLSARGWLFTVARHLVIDEARSARARREVSTDRLPEQAQADRTDSVFDSIVVTQALAALSIEHRSVLVRAYFGRRTVAEIAAELAIPPGTVKSRLHYGLRALRLALQEKGLSG